MTRPRAQRVEGDLSTPLHHEAAAELRRRGLREGVTLAYERLRSFCARHEGDGSLTYFALRYLLATSSESEAVVMRLDQLAEVGLIRWRRHPMGYTITVLELSEEDLPPPSVSTKTPADLLRWYRQLGADVFGNPVRAGEFGRNIATARRLLNDYDWGELKHLMLGYLQMCSRTGERPSFAGFYTDIDHQLAQRERSRAMAEAAAPSSPEALADIRQRRKEASKERLKIGKQAKRKKAQREKEARRGV